jgi:hypothetical protein
MLTAMEHHKVPGEGACAQDHDHEQEGPSTSEGKERGSDKVDTAGAGWYCSVGIRIRHPIVGL